MNLINTGPSTDNSTQRHGKLWPYILHTIYKTHNLTKESINVPTCKKNDKTDCTNYCGISFLSTTYKILSYILLSRLTPYAEEIIGDFQCGFWHNRWTTNHIFCICQNLEKKWEYKNVFKLNLWYSMGWQTCVWHISYQEWFETRTCFITTGFQLCVKYAIRVVQANQQTLKLNGTRQLLVYDDDDY
jgi:hypothetical protein